jgi:hypothetical protein
MRRNVAFLSIVAGLLAGVAAFPAYAELGLSGILSAQDEKAVGLAVKDAAKALYSSGQSDESIKAGIVEILNEAVATGSEEAVRYALVGVLVAGGAENLDLSKAAIDDSNAFSQFPDTTASVVASASLLISGAGGDGQSVAGGGGSNEKTLGGGTTQQDQYGGGSPADPIDGGSIMNRGVDAVAPVAPFGTIRDRDTSATPV